MTAGLAIYDTVSTSIATRRSSTYITFCRCRFGLTAVIVMVNLNVTLLLFSTFHRRYTHIA